MYINDKYIHIMRTFPNIMPSYLPMFIILILKKTGMFILHRRVA